LVFLLRDVNLPSMIIFVQDTGIRITILKKPEREKKRWLRNALTLRHIVLFYYKETPFFMM
jgi:hypothetical protein